MSGFVCKDFFSVKDLIFTNSLSYKHIYINVYFYIYYKLIYNLFIKKLYQTEQNKLFFSSFSLKTLVPIEPTASTWVHKKHLFLSQQYMLSH